MCVCITLGILFFTYIYIYKSITLCVTLSNFAPSNNFLLDKYFENPTIRLHVFYILNTCQILYQSDVIFYLIHKLIFYAQFYNTKNWNLNMWLTNDARIPVRN